MCCKREKLESSLFYRFLISYIINLKFSDMYIVINLTEKSNCTEESQKALNDSRPCSSDGLNHYNANIVLDRSGVVVSRYLVLVPLISPIF